MARGKRYTKEEKQKVVDFVLAYDKKNGRGGKAAAAKKFGVNINSVLAWASASKAPKAARAKKPGPAPKQKKAPAKATSVSEDKEVGMLERMLQIKKQVDELNAEYEKIKSNL